MSNQDLVTGLRPDEKQRYVEISPGVYAEQVAICDEPLESTDGVLHVKLPDVDVEDKSLSGIDHPHRMTHEGHLYGAYAQAVNGSELANNAAINVQITAVTHNVHLLWDAACGGDAEVYVYSGPTTSGGAAFTPNNRLFGGAAALSIVKTGVSISNVGTERQYRFLNGGRGPNSLGGSARGDNEFIITPGATFLFVLYNRSGQAKIAHLAIVFYELQ